MVPVIDPHPPCDPQVRLTALVPAFTVAPNIAFVNLGHGVFVGGAVVGLSVGLGVNVGTGVEVFGGIGVGGINPKGISSGSDTQLVNCPATLNQKISDSPSSRPSSHEPSPFRANGNSIVPLGTVRSGGSYTTPGPERRLRKLEMTVHFGTAVGLIVGVSDCSSLGDESASSASVSDGLLGIGVSLSRAAAVISASAIRVAATAVLIWFRVSGLGVEAGLTRSGRLQAARNNNTAKTIQ